jgi:hypothetical protein
VRHASFFLTQSVDLWEGSVLTSELAQHRGEVCFEALVCGHEDTESVLGNRGERLGRIDAALVQNAAGKSETSVARKFAPLPGRAGINKRRRLLRPVQALTC